MKFLAEVTESVETVIQEGNEGKKSYFIEGPFVNTEIKNRNGRYYPRAVLESQIENQQTLIRERRALGELNHPNTPNISLDRVSHLITELKWSGNDVIGKAKILESVPMGKIAAGLIEEGVKFGVSTRGLGSVKRKGDLNEVQSDFRLICVDLVSEPSGPTCFVDALVEGAEWIMNPVTGMWEQKIEQLREETRVSQGLTLEQKYTLFEKYLKIISG